MSGGPGYGAGIPTYENVKDRVVERVKESWTPRQKEQGVTLSKANAAARGRDRIDSSYQHGSRGFHP